MQNTEDMKNTGLIQTMKVLIFAEGIDGDIIRSCLKEKESFAGFIYEADLKKTGMAKLEVCMTTYGLL